MTEVGKISVRVSPDTSNFRRDLQRQLERIERASEVRVNINPDLDRFRQKVNASTKGLDAHIQVHADTSRARAEMLALQRTGGRGGIFSTLGASISEMTQSMGQSLATARPFGASIAVIAAAASLAVPAIGIMSGALAALPGVLAAIVAPLGAVLVGMGGIKQALINTGWATIGDRGKLKAGEQLAKLQESVSKVFETGLTPVFTKLLSIMPALEAGFGAIAQGLVGMTDGFVNALTSGRALEQIKGLMFNIGDSMTRAAPGIESFTASMLTLANSFSTKLPGMADGFNRFAENLSSWISKVTTLDSSGTSQFDRAMQGLGETLKGLGAVVGDLFLKGFDWLSNPSNIERISAFFVEVKNAVDLLWPVLDQTFSAVLRLVDGFNNLLAFFTGAWASITPGTPLAALTNGLQTVAALVSSVVQTVSSTWSAIPGIASAVWNSVVAAVSGALANVVSVVINGGAQIMAEVGSWPGKIQSFFADAGSWLVAAGQQIVQGLINGISGMITTAVAKAKELAGAVKNAVTGFLGIHSPSTVMADIGGFIGDGLINGLKSKQGEIEKTVKGISQGIKDGLDTSSYAQRGLDAGFAFAGANADQFMSDLGIGGKGLLSQLGEQGLKFGTDFASKALSGDTFNFQVANVDDAMAIKNNQINKRALGVVGKTG